MRQKREAGMRRGLLDTHDTRIDTFMLSQGRKDMDRQPETRSKHADHFE